MKNKEPYIDTCTGKEDCTCPACDVQPQVSWRGVGIAVTVGTLAVIGIGIGILYVATIIVESIYRYLGL